MGIESRHRSFTSCLLLILSFLPVPAMAGLESFFGPIFPPCGISSTFRSEVGAGTAFASIRTAQLTGGGREFDLRSWSALDKAPQQASVFGDLRLWRLGLRANYEYFDNPSHNNLFGRLAWSGARLGLDLDAIQHEWLTFGGSVDWYIINPRFNGAFLTTAANVPVTLSDNVTVVMVDAMFDPNRIDLAGEKPWTWGIYLRYMPPAILGIPVHFEGYYNLPLAGSYFTSYGATLSFRPQIYRFDLACKLGLEWSRLKFSRFTATTGLTATAAVLPPTTWELDMNWSMVKVELAAYF